MLPSTFYTGFHIIFVLMQQSCQAVRGSQRRNREFQKWLDKTAR
jgi:hypothetical protein